MGPAGTPALSSAASQTSRSPVAMRSASSGTSSSRFCTRCGLVAKRGSSASSGRSITRQ
ncbi:Uncharacterised protein [Bordetella pertussis]|nr:Uncharacterised protein [Bordetella pertussis]